MTADTSIRLYRAVPRKSFDASRTHVRYDTARLPLNVPYVIDNLWEYLRPVDSPSRRHAVYASPTPALALANASADPARTRDDVVCEVIADRRQMRIVQLQVDDARRHGDIALLLRVIEAAIGDGGFAAALERKLEVAPIFVPGLSKADTTALGAAHPVIDRVLAQCRATSTFWSGASPVIDPAGTGEMFFELVGGASYRLQAA